MKGGRDRKVVSSLRLGACGEASESISHRVQSSDGVVTTIGMCLASCLLAGSMHESRRERRRRRLSSAL